MNTTYLIIVAVIVVLIIVVALMVMLGLRRGKTKTITFAEEESPKELTQQEKSGNYQASGGFNFAPANAPKAEPEVLRGQRLDQSTPIPEVPDHTPAEGAADLPRYAGLTDPTHTEVEFTMPASAAPEAAPEVTPEQPEAEPKHEFEPPAEEGDLPEAPLADAAPAAPAAEPAPPVAETPIEDSHEPSVVEGVETQEEAPSVPAAIEELDAEESAVDEFADTPLFASVAEENPVDESAIREAEDAAEAARAQADAAGTALDETPVPEDAVVASPQPAREVEHIAPAVGRLGRLRGRLARSQNVIGQGVLGILSAGDLDEDAWEEIEDTLLMADLGTKVTMQVVDDLREKIAERGVASEAEARAMLRETLIEACKPELDRSIKAMSNGGKPAVVLVVGVNGTGKTTTTGKLARVLVSMGHTVLLGAADTFRAAAADQLETWGRRVGASTVRGAEGADPASVAFDAVARGVADQVHVVLIDTAGRLHTSVGLMDQLGKVKRVVEKKAEVDEVLLVLDATVGQNGLMQARTFRDVVDITGVVLTKLDGTAKGGIVFQVQEELGVPVKLVGLGEGADDLAPFEAESFVDALLG